MASKTIQQLTELSASPDASDAYVIVDVSDTTMAATGTNKKVTHTNAFGTFLTDLTGLSVGALSDVDLTGNADTYALLWDNTAGEWQPGPITSPTGEADFVASGTIANGDRVVLNAAGTVSTVSGAANSFGTNAEVDSNFSIYNAICYDTTNDKIVICYRDGGNSDYGTAIVGTVSGSTITFGTAVVFESAGSYNISCAFDANAGKVVIVYRDDGNTFACTSIVGTVSGTSISFGTAVVVDASRTDSTSVCYDSTAQKVVVGYNDDGNTDYGTGIVGTVSGTTISFGTATVFETSSTSRINCVYDSTNDKTVLSYRDIGNLNYGMGVVGTVSGTSISFGTPVTFDSGGVNHTAIAFDSANSKVAIGYTDTGNSNYGTGIVGTVSGTSISFGTATVFESAASSWISGAYNARSGSVGFAYEDEGNSSYGTAVSGTISGTDITFDSANVFEASGSPYSAAVYDPDTGQNIIVYNTNANTGPVDAIAWTIPYTDNTDYLGIAKAAISDTATGSIVIDGGIATNQSGLTPGQLYYVDVDGTLTTTDTGVVAGKAYSATDLQVFT